MKREYEAPAVAPSGCVRRETRSGPRLGSELAQPMLKFS